MSLDLSGLLDSGPELVEVIGGMEFRFSELPLAALARLQSWIRANSPHPIDSLKPHLEGLPESDRQGLLEKARREAMDWPPQIGTPEGAMALLGTEAGQVEALWEGLRVHHESATRDDAWRIYRALKREVARDARRGGETSRVKRIYATLFGTADAMDDDGHGLPKGPAAAAVSNGRSSPAAASVS